jgi:hypothetical protein
MDKTLKVLLILIFLALTANLFRPVFSPRQASADEPYQVAVLKSEFSYKMNELAGQISKLEQKFNNHTHSLKVCSCESGGAKVNVDTSKPQK